jgi:selenocysteine lyase/cysteine desulfurase
VVAGLVAPALRASIATGAVLDELSGEIRKFEEIGTRPAAPHLAIAEALTLHQGIGPERKEARMRYLRDYWARRLLEPDRVCLHTSLRPEFSCGLATFQVDGIDSARLNEFLWKEHRILTTAIQHDEFEGIRVSPSVYTTLEELDRFREAVERVMERGLPA